jgi:hypothetical protein
LIDDGYVRPDGRALRRFGLTLGTVFVLLGLWPALRHHAHPRVALTALGGSLAVLGALVPMLLLYPHRAWMSLGSLLGAINTRIILVVFFYVLITPLALVMKLLKRDAMRRRYDPNATTYRVPSTSRSPEHMKRMF